MSEIELFFLCCSICNIGCGDYSDYSEQLIKKQPLKVLYFYDDENDNKTIDTNIHKIIFYDQYSNIKDIDHKEILVIYNLKNNIDNILKSIYDNNGLTILNKKWNPKQIWVLN